LIRVGDRSTVVTPIPDAVFVVIGLRWIGLSKTVIHPIRNSVEVLIGDRDRREGLDGIDLGYIEWRKIG
jgi:hypothetical protein